jgi:hypothetical protein
MAASSEKRRAADYQIPPREQIRAQKTALQHVVTAAVSRLDEHHTEPEKTIFDHDLHYRYFMVPFLNGVMDIVSIGGIEEPSPNGLFVTIHVKSVEGRIAQMVHIQVPKTSSLVDDEEAIRMLKWYSPEKMEQLAGIIQKAEPISEAAFDAFMGPFQWIMPVVSF